MDLPLRLLLKSDGKGINRGKTLGTLTRAKNSCSVSGFLITTAKFKLRLEI